jgi:hypothetical protein
MKCPKCKYTVFDYLDTCPRCGKDLTVEKAKLNISSVKPNPPSLLGSLTGDLDDSSVELRVPESIRKDAEEMDLKSEEIYDDGSELDINIDQQPSSEPDKEAEFDPGDLYSPGEGDELEMEFTPDEPTTQVAEGGGEEEKVGEEAPDFKGTGDQESAQREETKKDSEAIDLDLEDLDLKLDFDEDEDSSK